ncbi:MAG: methionyl-tRNA formyltransferase [Saprospiraceae bacterium]
MRPKIIFMGTPEFAVASLDILVKSGYEVAAVVTATDKWGGRGGKQLLESAVKKYAVEHSIPVLQPEKLRDPAFLAALRSYEADLQIVVAFRMLPEVVWNMPPLGTFNLHGSLLPRYRGAAPINWAVINGDTMTGVTTFFIQHEIDTGNVILQKKLSIAPDENAGSLHDRMMALGAEAVLETVQRIADDRVSPTPQDDALATPAPKLTPDNTHLRFQQPAHQVYNYMRGLDPYPGAWAQLGSEKWKFFSGSVIQQAHTLLPGSILTDGKSYLDIACTDGFVRIAELLVPGKRRMSIADFLNGWRPPSDNLILE